MLANHYEAFFAVATHLSFSKAAEVLFISQPAVSKHIKKLEAEIGVPLFERKGNVIALTTSGEKLLEYLQKAKFLQRQITSDIDIIKDQFESRGELKVGASTTISLYVLPRILSSYHRKFPNIKLLLINRNSENVLRALMDKDIDLAIIEKHHQVNAVHAQSFMEDEIIPVCSSHSPYASQKMKPGELVNIPLALRERGSGTLSVLAEEMENHKIRLGDLNITARLGGTEALKNYLVEDIAVGFLSRLAVQGELEKGTLKEVHLDAFTVMRKFNFVMRKGEESAGIVKSFIKEAKRYYP